MPVQTRSQTKRVSDMDKIQRHDKWFVSYILKVNTMWPDTYGPESNEDKLRCMYEVMYNINEYFYKLLRDDFTRWHRFAICLNNKTVDYENQNYLINNCDKPYVKGFLKLIREIRGQLVLIFKLFNAYQ